MIRFLFFFLPLLAISSVAAASRTDSLLLAYSNSSADSVRLKVTMDLAWELRNTDAEQSIQFADEAATLAKVLGDSSALASAYLRKAVVFRKQGQYQEALSLIEQAMVLKQTVHDSLGLAMALGNLSQLRKALGQYEQAVAARLQSIDILRHPRYRKYQMTGLSNLASIYGAMGQHHKAIEHYEASLEVAEQLKDSTTVSRTWFNLGVSWYQLQAFEQAENYYEKALRYATHHQDQVAQARLFNSIGTLYFEKNESERALDFYHKAEELYDELGFATELVMIYNNFAITYEQQGRYQQAMVQYRKAAAWADSIGSPKDLSQVYLNLSRTFETLEQPDSALHYFRQHTVLNDSLFNAEKNRQILEVEEKYASAEKDRSIAELNQVKLAQEADITLRNILLGGAGLLAVLALLFGINYYQKLQAQKKLAAQEAELNRQSVMEVLKESELKSMNAYIDGESSERQRLAGELHDHLGSRLATVKLHYDYLSDQLPEGKQLETLQKANMLLAEVLIEVRQLAHNLTSGVLHQFGLVSATEDLCNAITASSALRVQMDAFDLGDRLPPALELALFRAIQELMTNVIKHARATEIDLQLIRHEEHISIIVEDNGRGFQLEESNKDSGLGLKSIDARITKLGGTFTIDSRPRHGTTCILEVPIINPSTQ